MFFENSVQQSIDYPDDRRLREDSVESLICGIYYEDRHVGKMKWNRVVMLTKFSMAEEISRVVHRVDRVDLNRRQLKKE